MTSILIVDDNPQNLYMLQVLLESHGFQVEQATHGAQALELARRAPPDLVISDILMPVMDGFSLCRAWRADPQLSRIPFVIYTATYTDPKDKALALGLGAARFLVKPQGPDEFLHVIRAVIAEYQGGKVVVPPVAETEEQAFLEQYNAALVRKLEDKLLELEASQDHLQQAHIHLQSLQKVSEAILNGQPMQDIAQLILDLCRERMPYQRASIVYYDFSAGVAQVLAAYGPHTPGMGPGARVPLEKFGPPDVLQNMQDRLIQDTAPLADESPGMRALYEQGVRSGIHIILRFHSRALGAFNVGAEMPEAFTPKDLDDTREMADLLALALYNAQVFGELRESESRYRDLVEHIHDVICTHDLEGRLLSVNPSASRLLGYEPDELVGMNVRDILAPETRDEFEEYLRTIQRDGAASGLMLVETSTGEKRTWEFNNTLRTEGIATPIVRSFARDVTEQTRVERERSQLLKQIQEQAQQLRQVMQAVPEGVLLLDAEGRVVLANPQADGYLHILAGAGVGDTLAKLGDRSLDELLTSPPKGLWHEVTGGNQVFEVIARPVEAGPEPYGWVLVIRDVTQEREIERRLQQQERLAAVGQLAAGIAHDFNNIMAVIILYAGMLTRSGKLTKRDREQIAIINQQGWHATRLIRQILDFSRQAVLEQQPFDLLPMLKEQVKLLQRTLPESIDIILGYGEAEYVVNADLTRMQQVIMNLAVNARDAMPAGGTLRIGLERIRVARSTSPPLPEMEAGEWIKLTVADTGTGIAPDVLPHIFEPFFTTKEPGEGSGLGLAQVYGIVGQHGGHIDVETRLGEGTTFIIYLPALAIRRVEPLTPGISTVLQGHGEVVLVVEDSAVLRNALVKSLEQINYRVLEAANGVEALAVMEEHGEHVALVLSDVVMPAMGGIALFHTLRERGNKVPIILLTGHTVGAELKELRDKGLSAWLPKPPSPEQLAQAIAKALSG